MMKVKGLSGSKGLEELCGSILTKNEAKCLYDNMTWGERMSKMYHTSPALFASVPRGPKCTTCIGSKASDIFGDLLSLAKINYYMFVKAEIASVVKH